MFGILEMCLRISQEPLHQLQALVVFVDGRNGTMPGALTAARAGHRIDIPWTVGEGCCKITWLACKGFDLAAGNQLDVRVPADLDQFG